MFRLIAAILACVLLCAQTPMLPGFPPGVFQSRAALDAGSAPAGPVCTPTAPLANNSPGGTAANRDFTVNINAAGSKTLIVATFSQNNDPTAVILDPLGVNTSLAKDIGPTGTGTFVGVYSSVVSLGGSQLIRVTGAGAFTEVGILAYTCTGLTTGFILGCNGTGGGASSCTIANVLQNDFLISITYSSSGLSSFASSTENATAVVTTVDNSGPSSTGAAWNLVLANHNPFMIAATTGTVPNMVAASYR